MLFIYTVNSPLIYMPNIKIKRSRIHPANTEKGVTTIEYALIAALLFVAIVVGASLYSTALGNAFGNISTVISNALPA